MDSIQRINSLIILRGGAKKSAFQRFHSTHDCLSYPSTLSMAYDFGSKWEADMMKWVHEVDKDNRLEKYLI